MLILDSHIEGAQEFNPRQRGDIYRAIIEYGYYGIEPDYLKGEAKGYFIAIKPTLDTSKARSNAGKKSGEARRAKAEQKANSLFSDDEQTPSKTRTNTEQIHEQNANEEEEEIEEEIVTTNVVTTPIPPSVFEEIIGYLNSRAQRDYKPTSEATRKLIRARLEEGYTVDDFKRVIDNKVASWLDDPKMDAYLRPSTLFQKSKFEGYLNERPKARRGGGSFDKYAD